MTTRKSKRPLKLVLLGNLGVGKTAMLRRLRDGSFRDTSFSSGAAGTDKHTKAFKLDNGETIFLDIWDTAGMEGFRTVTRSYYNGAKAVVMVYDTTMAKSFYDLHLWLTEAHAMAPDAIPVLIGNKFDLEEDIDIDEKVTKDFARANDIQLHFKVSVKTNQGVLEAFEEIARYLHYGNLELTDTERNRQSSIMLHEHPEALKKHRCVGSCARP